MKRIPQHYLAIGIVVALLAPDLLRAADPDISALCGKLATYNWGESRSDIAVLNTRLLTADGAGKREIETALISILESADSTDAAKHYTCRMLRVSGSEASVPALGKLLLQPDPVGQMAVFALDGIAHPTATAALRGAAGRITDADVRAAILVALGRRRDSEAVTIAAAAAGKGPVEVRQAALWALGQIGTAEAGKALLALPAADGIRTDWHHAHLVCAEHLADAGALQQASALYGRVRAEAHRPEAQSAALAGLASLGSPKAVQMIVTMLTNGDEAKQQAALAVLPRIPGAEATRMIVGALPKIAPAALPAVITALGNRGDRAAAPAVRGYLNANPASLQAAATGALAQLGDASDVAGLTDIGTRPAPVGPAAARTLAALRGEGVDKALTLVAVDGSPAVRLVAIAALVKRGATAAVPALFDGARDNDRSVRRESIKGLTTLAGPPHLETAARLLTAPRDSRDIPYLERLVVSIAGKFAALDDAAKILTGALWGAADTDGRKALLGALARLGGDRALATIRGAMANQADLREACVRALAVWPGLEALEDLEAVAKSNRSDLERILALRGYLRLLTDNDAAVGAAAVPKAKTALGIARTAGERKLVLGYLGTLRDTAALDLAASLLTDGQVNAEASTAVVGILNRMNRAQQKAAAEQIKAIAGGAASPAREKAQLLLGLLDSSDYESEDATIRAGAQESNHSGFQGKGFINFTAPSGAYIEWEIGVTDAGPHRLIFRYALGGGNRPLNIFVDGNLVKEKLPFPSTGAWNVWKTAELRVDLKQGTCKVRAETAGSEGPNIDVLKVVPLKRQ